MGMYERRTSDRIDERLKLHDSHRSFFSVGIHDPAWTVAALLYLVAEFDNKDRNSKLALTLACFGRLMTSNVNLPDVD